MELMNLFMVDLHFSPFMSLYNSQDTVHACVIAENDSMLKYIVTNSNLEPHKEEKWRYNVPMEHRKEFLEQRKYPDECGNNALHFVFNCEDEEKRWEYLELLLKEEIGDLSARNISNFLPH